MDADADADADTDDDISTKPFVEQPAFGRGLWRYPIKFVPAASTTPPPSTGPTPDPKGLSIAEKYLAIVFPNGRPQPPSEAEHAFPICGICGEPVKETNSRAHYFSPAHQLSLPRAPMPSSIDRTRMGLKYMEKYNFDVDARVGLGANGQGILFPILPKEKTNKHGLGFQAKKAAAEERKVVKLDAGKTRKQAALEKKRVEKLRHSFYGDGKIEKYLGDLEG